jgi:hypothetical protein
VGAAPRRAWSVRPRAPALTRYDACTPGARREVRAWR